MSKILDAYDLAQQLRQEQLLITSEKTTFAQLQKEFVECSSKLYKMAWISSRQRQNLSNMVLARPDLAPDVCSQRSMQLENSQFIEIYHVKSLKHQHLCGFINLLAFLENSPTLLAECMAIADQINQIIPSQNDSIVQIVCDGLYGSLINDKDIDKVLQILERLMELQIVNSDNIRRMLTPGSSSFARLYQRLHESIPSAKLFLVAALYEPVMAVLFENNKVDLRETSDSFAQADKHTIEQNAQKLFAMASKFVKSLKDNWELFPNSLSQLLKSLCIRLQQNNLPENVVHCIITDLVFTYFICPAVVSPDLFGVSNIQVDHIARHNLIQIGQIIQKLALYNYEPVADEMSRKLIEKFETDTIHKLTLQIINKPMVNSLNFNAAPASSQLISIRREKLFITRTELNLLLDFLRTAIENDGLLLNTDSRKQLVRMLGDLPIRVDPLVLDVPETSQKYMGINTNHGKLSKSGSVQHHLANVELVQNPIESRASSFINGNIIRYGFSDEVLVFPMKYVDDEQLKLPLEEEIVTSEKNKSKSNTLTEKSIEEMSLCNEVKQTIDGNNGVVMCNTEEKESRFAILRDDGSIGNASDNLEAASEAPSNHSGSSLDLEENDQNDNLSDMVSANVSGRGSPNISGRDTPSSQVTENSNNPIPAPQMAQMMNKNRSDIEDKFCKFEIKKLMEGDETISIISDTWSTDVLASDSEAVEANDRNFATPLIPTNVVLPGDHNYDPMISSQFRHGNILDVSETQSESAWSTDVLASDSEKLAEVDNEDNQSITAKSDADSTNKDIDLNGAVGFSLRKPESPFFSCKLTKVNNRTPTSARTPESPYSNRSYDESPKGFDGAKFSANFSKAINTNGVTPDTTMNCFKLEDNSLQLNNSRKDLLRQISSDTEHILDLIEISTNNINGDIKFKRGNINDINIIKSDPNIVNPFFEENCSRENGIDPIIEARYVSEDQRNANSVFKRNGVIGLPRRSEISDDLINLDIGPQNDIKPDLFFDQIQNFSKKNGNGDTKQPNAVKQSRSTGAIPKSISFDASADKGQNRRSGIGGGGLLNKIKGLANMKSRRNRTFNNEENNFGNLLTSSTPHQETLDTEESSDDILGKYRRKISTSSDPATSDSVGSNSSSSIKSKSSQSDIAVKNPGENQHFDDVKAKVKVVLSKTKTPSANLSENCRSSISSITTYLQSQLSDAIVSQSLQNQAFSSEALRCLGPYNSVVHAKLLQQIQSDLLERQRYTQYLLMRRKQLLVSLENIRSLGFRIEDDNALYMRQLIMHSLNLFLEKRSEEMQRFYQELSGLSMSDEKIELLEEFVKILIDELREDGILKGVVDERESEVRDCMERLIMQHVYTQLMFPNDDVDRSRDLVLREHIKKLSKVVTPSHKLLRISSEYMNAAPWPLAQQQILHMTAFRKPIEKVLCVVRACLCIMNLLAMLNQKPPAADDFTPVLIYVIIKANPPHLLSTIQFVNNFIEDKLEGEENYWWTQFVTCVEFIKTMD